MKKILTLLLVLAIVFSLAACGEQEQDLSNDGSTPGTSQTEGNGDSSDNTDEPSNTDNPDSSDDELSVENFLKVYGFTEDDIMPEHFVSFEDVKLEGNVEPGELQSAGYIKINVDKDATTQEDINAWFDGLYAKMAELSKDGKLYSNYSLEKEATPIEDLKAGPLWADLPGGSCYYSYDLPIGTSTLVIVYTYYVDKGVYELTIGVNNLTN